MDLPRDLELPLESGAAWWYWLGGRPALDFVNTRRERWWRDVETLVTPDDLAQWLVRAGLVVDEPQVDAALLDSACELREAINVSVLDALDGWGPATDPALAVIDRWLAQAVVPDRLVRGDGPIPVLTQG